MEDKLVWYVCYGSNLTLKRFLCYFNGKPDESVHIKKAYLYEKNPDFKPLDIKRFTINHNLFFANDGDSRNWGTTGVAFIDWKHKGRCLGRAYLITEDALHHLHRCEGRHYPWYDKLLLLDKKVKDSPYPVYTFTCENPERRTRKDPMPEYLDVMRMGLHELGIGPFNSNRYLEYKVHPIKSFKSVGLSNRAANVLRRAGYHNVNKVEKEVIENLHGIPNMTTEVYLEILEKIFHK